MLELLKGSIQTKSADLEVIYHHINRHLLRFCQFLNFLYQFGNLIRPESCEFLLTVKMNFPGVSILRMKWSPSPDLSRYSETFWFNPAAISCFWWFEGFHLDSKGLNFGTRRFDFVLGLGSFQSDCSPFTSRRESNPRHGTKRPFDDDSWRS